MWVADKVLAGLVVAACLVLLLRLCLSARLRHRLDRSAVGAWHGTRQALRRIRYWRTSRQEAARVAEEAIRRAQDGSWHGNVYTPKSFRKPRKPH